MSLPFVLLSFAAGLALGSFLRRRPDPGAATEDTESRLQAAVATERERIYADLHDDLGAKLLQLVYGASAPEQADLARTALQDLRDVVSRSRGCQGSLLEVLGEMEVEMIQPYSWYNLSSFPMQQRTGHCMADLLRIASS